MCKKDKKLIILSLANAGHNHILDLGSKIQIHQLFHLFHLLLLDDLSHSFFVVPLFLEDLFNVFEYFLSARQRIYIVFSLGYFFIYVLFSLTILLLDFYCGLYWLLVCLAYPGLEFGNLIVNLFSLHLLFYLMPVLGYMYIFRIKDFFFLSIFDSVDNFILPKYPYYGNMTWSAFVLFNVLPDCYWVLVAVFRSF